MTNNNNNSTTINISSNVDFTSEIGTEPTPQTVNDNKKKYTRSCCSHLFCDDCISKYLQVKLEEANESEGHIKFPGRSILYPLWCRFVIPPSVLDKRCHVQCQSVVLSMFPADRSDVYCPFPADSSEFILNGSNIAGQMVTGLSGKCSSCKALFCLHCRGSTRYTEKITIDNNKEAIIRSPMFHQFHELVKAGCLSIGCRMKMKNFLIPCAGRARDWLYFAKREWPAVLIFVLFVVLFVCSVAYIIYIYRAFDAAISGIHR